MARASNREELLKAAVRVASQHGAAALTLDAVAQQAGVSKGGLLYHFASKDELLRGLLAWELDGFEAELEEQTRTDARPGAFLRAYLALSIQPGAARVPLGVLSAYAFEPGVLDEVRVRLRDWQARATQDVHDQAAALTLLLAADGAWLAALLGAPISHEQAAALAAQAEALISREKP